MQHKIGTEFKDQGIILVRNLESRPGKIVDASVLTSNTAGDRKTMTRSRYCDRSMGGSLGAGKNVYHGSNAGRKTGRDGQTKDLIASRWNGN